MLPLSRHLLYLACLLWLPAFTAPAEADPAAPGFALELGEVHKQKNGSSWTVSFRPHVVNRGQEDAKDARLEVTLDRGVASERRELDVGDLAAGATKSAGSELSYSFDVEREEPPSFAWRLIYEDQGGVTRSLPLKP